MRPQCKLKRPKFILRPTTSSIYDSVCDISSVTVWRDAKCFVDKKCRLEIKYTWEHRVFGATRSKYGWTATILWKREFQFVQHWTLSRYKSVLFHLRTRLEICAQEKLPLNKSFFSCEISKGFQWKAYHIHSIAHPHVPFSQCHVHVTAQWPSVLLTQRIEMPWYSFYRLLRQ